MDLRGMDLQAVRDKMERHRRLSLAGVTILTVLIVPTLVLSIVYRLWWVSAANIFGLACNVYSLITLRRIKRSIRVMDKYLTNVEVHVIIKE